MKRTSKLERALFRAVHILILVAALLALLAAIGLGVNGLIKSGASSNERIQAPSISFEAYTQQLAREKEAQDSAREEAERDKATAGEGAVSSPKKSLPPSEPEQFPSRYRDVLNEIEKSIADYARKTGQPSPTESLRRNLFLEAQARFDSYGLIDDFFVKLGQVGKSLDGAGEELSKLEDNDPRKIFWGKFLDYVYDTYQADLSRQTDKISNARYEAEKKRREAPVQFSMAGIALGAFFSLTLLLVLLNIEKNTYVTSAILRSVYPDAYKEPEISFKKRPSAGPKSGNSDGTAS